MGLRGCVWPAFFSNECIMWHRQAGYSVTLSMTPLPEAGDILLCQGVAVVQLHCYVFHSRLNISFKTAELRIFFSPIAWTENTLKKTHKTQENVSNPATIIQQSLSSIHFLIDSNDCTKGQSLHLFSIIEKVKSLFAIFCNLSLLFTARIRNRGSLRITVADYFWRPNTLYSSSPSP